MKEKFPQPYEQRYKYSCGAATAKIVYEMLGINFMEERLMAELQTDYTGTAWEQMFNHFVENGFETDLYGNGSYEDLEDQFSNGPVIVSWMADWDGQPGGHYSVIGHIDEERIVIADPADGQMKEFERGEWMSKWRDETGRKTFMVVREQK